MYTLVIPAWIGITIGWVISGAALWKGGRCERIAATAFLLTWIGASLTKDRDWVGTQWAGFGMDVALFAALFYLAMRSPRWWPLLAAGFQLLAVITHAASLIDRKLGAWAYITAGVIFTYLLLAALGVGTWNRWRERRHRAEITAAFNTPRAIGR